ncbi:MAG: hypothetical protein IT379_07715 [Deltaproteobacteria bacterium]|nr:hypothetical protein [Deltaproteobacteria bacterium]
MGRVDLRDANAARMGWPATAFALRFRGTSIVLRLRDVPRQDETPDADWISVSIDDAPARAFRLRRGDARYPVARGLAPGEHTLVVAKRTEAEVGVVELRGVELGPRTQLLRGPRRRARRIEVLGDSVTTGFGNLGRDATCSFEASTQNALTAYAVLAARDVGAEVSLVAWSGKGVGRNADGRDAVALPALYDRAVPESDAAWDLSRDVPDVVVVNLGANDFFRGTPPRDAFVGAYRALLERVRRARPDALVLVVLSPMLFDDATHTMRRDARAWLDALVAERRSAGDVRLEIVDQWADAAEGFGCQFHPSARAHVRLARELSVLLRARLGW